MENFCENPIFEKLSLCIKKAILKCQMPLLIKRQNRGKATGGLFDFLESLEFLAEVEFVVTFADSGEPE